MSAVTAGRAWVTRCALSRVCGSCGESLGRPIAFLGTLEEQGRNGFHQPPMHVACAHVVRSPDEVLVATSGFEFVRPGREADDRRPTFQPNSLL